MSATYLVTGGAGFIGSHLAAALARAGERVRVIDDLSTGRIANLNDIEGRFEFVRGDIRDRECVRRAFEGVRFVLHQAALPSVPRSVKDPETSHEVNVTGTLNLLQASREAGVKRFVFASSSSVYGEQPAASKTEDLPPRPRSPYAAAKLAAEAYVHAFYHTYGLETVSLRYFNVFGPRQDPGSAYAAVIPRFAAALLAGESATIYGDGDQTRDFTFIDNVVDGNMRALESPEAAGAILNVACGEQTSVNELYQALQEITGCAAAPRHESPRPGDIRHSTAGIAMARRVLGYAPTVGLRDGLERTVSALAAGPR